MKKIFESILMGLLLPFLKGFILSILIGILLALLLLASPVLGQGMVVGLKAGDSVPVDVLDERRLSIDLSSPIASVVPTKSIALSDFKGKLIILDFWGTWCSSCLARFPKLKLLQDKYRNELAIIIVNNEPLVKTYGLLSSRLKQRGELFYNIVLDTNITALFPHRTVPHYAWVGKDGKVMSVLGSDDITEENINAALKNGELNITQKIDISPEPPLFSSIYLPKDNLIKYSVFSRGGFSGLPAGRRKRMDNSGRICRGNSFSNHPMEAILKSIAIEILVPEGYKFSDYNLLYEGRDLERFQQQVYNYEFIGPVEKAADLYPLMLEDLNDYSPYVAEITTRKMKCLGLFKLGDELDADGWGKYSIKKDSLKTGSKPIKNVDILVSQLNGSRKLGKLVSNETGANDKLHIVMDIQQGFSEINAELKKYGYYLKPMEKEFQVMVVRDK